MKKMMLMAAVLSLLGTAGAAGTLNAPTQFTANVTEVCRVGTLVFNPVINAPLTVVPTFNYNAGMATGPTSTSTLPLTIECTAGTTLTTMTTPDDGVATTLASVAGNYTTVTPAAAMNLTNGANKLNGTYQVTSTKVASSNQTTGDKYTGGVTYTATPGQWGAPAGTYVGTLTVVISY